MPDLIQESPAAERPRGFRVSRRLHWREAPQPFQWAGAAAALDADMGQQLAAYRRKRDMIVEGLAGLYEVVRPGGAFYVFPKAPWGTATQFVTRAIEKYQLLVIPGSVFSRRDTHFRISYAASDETISRGIEALRKLAVEAAPLSLLEGVLTACHKSDRLIG